MKEQTKKELLAEMRLEDVPAPIKKIADEIGLENFLKLVYTLGGLRLYVPKLETVTAKARDRLILQEFDGGNYNELAQKYAITEVWVRQVVNRRRQSKNQVSLFET